MKQQWEPPELEEMPVVILSLHQKWWQKMAAGEKPKAQKSEYPTLPGQLGYLNSYYCPVCGKHLFSAYDKDLRKDREDGYYFHVSRDFNYCSKCGTLLDLDEWKREEEPAAAGEELTLED